MLHLAHIVNPFKAMANSDLNIAQKLTFASMLNAKANAGSIKIELFSAQFEEDMAEVPKEFIDTKNLTDSVLNFQHFKEDIKLPLIGDILERLYTSTNADFLIYSNVDIGLFPQFYLKVEEFIKSGHDAFIINRRRLQNKFNSVEQLPIIYKETGKSHPGFDCFVFRRDLFPKFKLEGICIGVPFIEISFSQNLFAYSSNFKLYDKEILTFHIGEEIFRKRAPKEYFYYNRKKFHLIEKQIKKDMKIENFPYYELNPIHRLFVWTLHPCIPIRIALQLELKRIFKKITFFST
jgi:hypothetical protein